PGPGPAPRCPRGGRARWGFAVRTPARKVVDRLVGHAAARRRGSGPRTVRRTTARGAESALGWRLHMGADTERRSVGGHQLPDHWSRRVVAREGPPVR